jgi:ABC-type branched-subunit amino acid transport system ATPase component
MAEQSFHQAIRIADRGYIIVHGENRVREQVGRRPRRERPD